MIIDSHAHVLLPTTKQLEIMDQTGIDRTVLFSTTIHPELASDVKELEVEMSILNQIISGQRNALEAKILSLEEQVQVIRENPSRFWGFGTVPLGLTQEETSIWINERVVQNNFVGLGEFTLAPGQVKQLEPVFIAAMEFGGMPLWVHTFAPLNFDDIKTLHDLSKCYPQVPVIMGHLGGFHWLETIKLAKQNKSLYLDLSATFTTIAPLMAIKEIPNRTLFSSDAPYGDPWLARQTIERIISDKYIKRRVLGETIAELIDKQVKMCGHNVLIKPSFYTT